MDKFKDLLKRRLRTSFLCLMALVAPVAFSPTAADAAVRKTSKSASKKSSGKKNNVVKNTFDAPDFAFPRTVSKNAQTEFDKAMKNRDGIAALKAAIQLDVAESQISADTYAASIARFDSVARVLPAPWSNLSLMLEARLFSEIYRADSWTYNQRKLPPTPVPDNVMEWSKPMFEAKISSLIEKAFDGNASLGSPLSSISGLLADYAEAEKAGFSVLDFMTCQANYILSSQIAANAGARLPFGKANAVDDPSAGLCMKLIDDAIERHAADSDLKAGSFFCNMKLNRLSGDAYDKYLEECVTRFKNTPYCATFILAYSRNLDGMESARRRLEMLSDYIGRYPNANGAGLLKDEVASITRKEVNAEFDRQMLPGVANKVRVSGKNIYDFYLLVCALKPLSDNDNYRYSQLSSSKVMQVVPVSVKGSSPDSFKDTVEIASLPPGYYAIVPSATRSLSGVFVKNPKAWLSVTNVSDLSVVRVRPRQSGESLYVVSGVNQRPIAGAKVTLWPIKRGVKGVAQVKTTDKDGCVKLTSGQYEYRIEAGGSMLSDNIYIGRDEDYKENTSVRGSVLADLSIYKPGDKVRFSAVAYTRNNKQLASAAEGTPLRFVLRDANWQNVDTVSLVTDAYGRCDGEFTLPKSGLLGSWGINMLHKDLVIDNSAFEVAEYKSPTFLATLESSSESFKAGEILKFKGKAMTYSGMPVSGGKVAYTVEQAPMWWRASSGGASYGGETVTAADGTFVIELPTEAMVGTDYARGSYILKATVTDAAGETQSAPSLRFALGNALNISATLPARIDASAADASYKVSVIDLTGNPVSKKLYYEISSDGKAMASGEFETPVFIPEFGKLHSGKYAVRLSLTPDFKSTDECKIFVDSVIVWRPDDLRPPVASCLWIPETKIVVPAGTREVKVRVGSSYADSHILAVISDSRKLIRTEWVKVSDGFATVKVDVPADNERVFIEFCGERNLSVSSETVTLIPYEQTVSLQIKTETFRDKIEPGAEETWKFFFSLDGKKLSNIPAMAVMSNKALNALNPFSWSFNPFASLSWNRAAYASVGRVYSANNSYYASYKNSTERFRDFMTPQWNTYGYSLYARNIMIRGTRMYTTQAKMANNMKSARQNGEAEEILEDVMVTEAPMMAAGADMAIKAESVVNESKDSDEEVESEDGGATPEKVEALREIDVPLAFFMPRLATDADGLAVVSFKAPDFVGTWQFQLMGYTPDMKGAVITLDAVSAKKVMARLNAPRFVRTGDNLSVSATVYNNTEAAAEVTGRLEFFNPMTGETISAFSPAASKVAAGESCVVTYSMPVSSDINVLGIRAYGEIPGHTDGEQTIIPVLPSSTPVVESTPFYIAPDKSDFSLKLPKFDKDARITLTYCDNPVWECVTALPSLVKPESVNILSQVQALFGNSVAAGLFDKYPRLIEGIRIMASPENASDSTLCSPLQKNQALKTVLLNNTPWVNDANSETERMQSLVKYADTAEAKAAIAEIVKTLKERQNNDGGWSWCPEMKSSEFMTYSVLRTMAKLKNLGFLPADAEKLTGKAFGYVDRELAKDWNQSERKYFSVTQLLDYLYAKSAFPSVGGASSFRPLEIAAMKEITSSWREFSIADKATAAILLERRGNAKTARIILESLSQFASVSEEKGMWFDNLSSGWNSMGPLLTTARVLEAFALIEPQNPAVDRLRQWLVVSKQTQNWGDRTASAEAICALLTSGSDWTASSASPVVMLNGSPVALPKTAAVTGSFTVNIPVSASGATLGVNHQGAGPAWGGVVSQYVAPILDVKAASVPQLSIKKSVYVVTPGASGQTASAGNVKVGDRVRVTITLTCDRDLEYVALTDPRAACLEPADQISSYTTSDGVAFYREVRDDSTNLFIPFLSKGTHVISYDCFADRAGDYSLGVANAQSQYAPVITAHSAGALLPVK